MRLGALVYDNDYKHPVVLAKELATMDVLSEGRVEVGLGAGWMITDYEQAGIAYDPPGVRISRLIEGVAVVKGAFGDGAFSFAGEHYTITNYDGRPKPVQSPPPLLIGGGGPRMLRFAAREADIVGINATLTSGAIDATTFDSMTPDAVDGKVAVVRDAARAAGRLDDIEMNIRAFIVMITDDVDGSLDTLAEFHRCATRGDRSVTLRARRSAGAAHRPASRTARTLGFQLRDRRAERRGRVRSRGRRAPRHLNHREFTSPSHNGRSARV